MTKCPICNGKGYQEEKLKGFRRYNCWCCNGTKQIKSLLDELKEQTKMKKRRKSKYRILRGFDNQMKAQKYLDALGTGDYSIKMRQFPSADKKRYYVRQLIKQGVKSA